MTVMKNIGNTNLSFTTGSKNGEPLVEDLRVGETKNINIDPDNVEVQARINSQQIVLGRASAAAARVSTRANRIEDPAPASSEGS